METVQIIVNETVEKVNVTVNQAVAGLSAYMDAVINGSFVGTKEEWFASLKGKDFKFEDFTPEQLEALSNGSTMMLIKEGERRTGDHAGYFGEQWLSDDYHYFCVKAGLAGVAIWKKTLLFQT